jgi:ComF family protein
MLQQIVKGLGQLVYPRLCMGCNKPLLEEEEILCLNCNVYNIPRTAYHHIAENETAMRFAGRIPVQGATSFAYFANEGLLQHLLHELKYNDREDIGVYLGRQLGYDLQQTNWASAIDAIVPVPLHPEKEKLRGYNQSQRIAEGMGSVLGLPVMAAAVSRVRNTDSQTQKSREERIENMKEAFSVTEPQKVQGKHLLVIDDVLTTGATIETCALALLAIPGVTISVATIGVAS